VAALAKPHREIERRNVEQEREERAGPVRDRVHEPGAEHHGQHRKQPRYGTLPSFAGIEQPLEEGRITREERIQTAPVGKRTPLLEQKRRDEGKEAHGFDSRWAGDSVRQERKQVHEASRPWLPRCSTGHTAPRSNDARGPPRGRRLRW